MFNLGNSGICYDILLRTILKVEIRKPYELCSDEDNNCFYKNNISNSNHWIICNNNMKLRCYEDRNIKYKFTAINASLFLSRYIGLKYGKYKRQVHL